MLVFAALVSLSIAQDPDKVLCDRLYELSAGNEHQRVEAAHYFSRCKNRVAVPYLIANLNHSNSAVRRYSTEALGEIRDQAAVMPLINALIKYEARVLDNHEGKSISQMYITLEDLTGHPFEHDIREVIKYRNKLVVAFSTTFALWVGSLVH